MTLKFRAAIAVSAVLLGAGPDGSSFLARAAHRSPPADAIVLFDGKNLDAWASQKSKSWEEADGPADWKITRDGALEVVPNAGSLISRKRFSDFHLYFEFRLPEGDVNGGVFLLARYELGIKGSSDAPAGLPCCAFENLERPIRPAKKVLSPPHEWQVVEVDFRAPRFDDRGKLVDEAHASVTLNGVRIHDDVQLGPRKGAAKRLRDAREGYIMLQDHGAPYQFRNIWIVDQSHAAARSPEAPSKK